MDETTGEDESEGGIEETITESVAKSILAAALALVAILARYPSLHGSNDGLLFLSVATLLVGALTLCRRRVSNRLVRKVVVGAFAVVFIGWAWFKGPLKKDLVQTVQTFRLEPYYIDGLVPGAFLRDVNNNQVFTFAVPASTSLDAVRQHVRSFLLESGATTAAYYFMLNDSSSSRAIAFAEDVSDANHMLYEKPGISTWRFVYAKGQDGTELFVDCQITPADRLCRQH
jgi:hypothetical protein